jgi:hypothetical protein
VRHEVNTGAILKIVMQRLRLQLFLMDMQRPASKMMEVTRLLVDVRISGTRIARIRCSVRVRRKRCMHVQQGCVPGTDALQSSATVLQVVRYKETKDLTSNFQGSTSMLAFVMLHAASSASVEWGEQTMQVLGHTVSCRPIRCFEPHGQGARHVCFSSVTTDKAQLLEMCARCRPGTQTNGPDRDAILSCVARLASTQNGQFTTGVGLSATWKLVWTTEKVWVLLTTAAGRLTRRLQLTPCWSNTKSSWASN